MTTDLQYVPLASLDLLRQITDRHVIDQLLTSPAMTRADIAAATGISKPTISESVRRLEQSGLLVPAGEQTGRRGRAGTFYALPGSLGVAYVRAGAPVRGHADLAGEPAYMITVGPDGAALRLIDCFGALGLLRAGSAAIDVARVREALHGE